MSLAGRTTPTDPYGVEYLPSGPADHHVFNSAWGPPSQAVPGTATRSSDLTAIQRLKADAVREAAGADAATTTRPQMRFAVHRACGPGPVPAGGVSGRGMERR